MTYSPGILAPDIYPGMTQTKESSNRVIHIISFPYPLETPPLIKMHARVLAFFRDTDLAFCWANLKVYGHSSLRNCQVFGKNMCRDVFHYSPSLANVSKYIFAICSLTLDLLFRDLRSKSRPFTLLWMAPPLRRSSSLFPRSDVLMDKEVNVAMSSKVALPSTST